MKNRNYSGTLSNLIEAFPKISEKNAAGIDLNIKNYISQDEQDRNKDVSMFIYNHLKENKLDLSNNK
jgi:hypothetical protein